MRANVYVDGFNFYNRLLKRRPEAKWLDLRAFFQLVLPHREIHRIYYFTARVEARDDPGQPERQDRYLYALRTIPNLEIEFGQFRTDAKALPIAAHPGALVTVLRTVEKGSDVNLATRLLVEALSGDIEEHWVVSGDSDLVAPIRAVRASGHHVGILNPAKFASKQLLRAASEYRSLRAGPLLASQFPDTVQTPTGNVVRPAEWTAGWRREAGPRRVMTYHIEVHARTEQEDVPSTS
jgi:uncharacterized LabA/DUF88 family protein